MTGESIRRIENLFQLGLVLVLVIGCWLVLQPFLSAILFSIVVAVATWPVYRWLLARLRGRKRLASVLACLAVVLVVVTPAAMVMNSFTDGLTWLLKMLEERFATGPPPPPAWLAHIPLLGPALHDYWRALTSDGEWMKSLLPYLAEPGRRFALASGRAVGVGMLQAVLAVFMLYFLYRDGDMLGRRLREAAERIAGDFAHGLLATAENTVVAVMVGVFGAGIAQATVATVGFAIAGVPQPFVLGALTFVLSLIPWGPVLIWGGAALWLFQQDQPGWCLFMVVYGWLGISSVDNFVKPMLISRANKTPFVFTLVGVLGGVLAFGVAGVFIGPTLLALAINLTAHWLEHTRANREPA